MRAALYARLSREDRGTERIKIPDQLAACRARAAELHATVVASHADDGISGALDERHRPGLRAVLALAESGAIDLLILREQSRLARGEDLMGHLRTLLSRAGVAIQTVMERQASDLERGVRTVIDAEYVRRSRELSRAKGRARAARGERLGGRPPFGYRWDEDRLLIVPDEARAVRRCYQMALDGTALRQIARALAWPVDRVSRTLRSPWYAGDYAYGRTRVDAETHRHIPAPREDWILLPDHHRPLIPRAEWERVQALLGSARARWTGDHPPGTGARLPLSGLLICSECGGALSVSGLSRRRQRDGLRWHYYACREAHQDGGPCPGVGHHSVEGWVSRLLAGLAEVYSAQDLPEALHRALAHRPEAAAVAREIRRREREVDGLLAVIRAGVKGTAAARIAEALTEAQSALDAARGVERRDREATRPVVPVASIRADLRELSRTLRAIREEPPPEIARPLLHRHIRRIVVSRAAARAEIDCGAVLDPRDSAPPGPPWGSVRRLVAWRLVANRKARS